MVNYKAYPVGLLVPIVVFGSLGADHLGSSQREKTVLRSLLRVSISPACWSERPFALYPVSCRRGKRSTASPLTIPPPAHHGLSVGFYWWTIGMVLAIGYFVFVYRMFRGKVRLDGEGY